MSKTQSQPVDNLDNMDEHPGVVNGDVELNAKVEKSDPADEVDVDRIVEELGSFGWFQVRTYGLIVLPIVFSAIYNCQYVFAAAEAANRCVVPECEPVPGAEGVTGAAWMKWALPAGNEASCRRYRPRPEGGGNCTSQAFSDETQPCDSRVYENDHSVVATFDLGCAEWKRTLVGSIHSAGTFAALPLTGYISDRYGRRLTLVLTAVSAGVVGVARSFANSYLLYVVLEFLEATTGSGVYSTGFLLALEMVSSRSRVLGGNVISSTYALGQAICAGLAYAVPQWRALTRVLYAPSVLFVCYMPLLHESVRWLLARGRRRDAAHIIYRAAEMNKKKLSPATIAELSVPDAPRDTSKGADSDTSKGAENDTSKGAQTDTSKGAQTDTSKGAQSDTFKGAQSDTTPVEPGVMHHVLHSRIMMSRVCICSFWWITTTLVYYGLSINSVSLAGEPHLNYALMAFIELPGYALSVLTLDRFGRKYSIITAYAVCGAVLVALPLTPEDLSWLSTVLGLAGKLCISMAFSSIYIYTSELFPTAARHRLLATCSMVGRIGTFVAPQTPLLIRVTPSLPYLLFGGMSWISAVLMLLTPETLHARLPDTVQQAEHITRHEQHVHTTPTAQTT